MKQKGKNDILKNAIVFAIAIIILIQVIIVHANTKEPYLSQTPHIKQISTTSLEVSWSPYNGYNNTTHYQVQLNHVLYGSSTKLTKQIVNKLQPGGSYKIQVSTYHNGKILGVSSPTAILMPPTAPTLLGANNIGSASVELYWQNVDTATNYRVYLASEPESPIVELSDNQTKIFITGLTPGSKPTFWITALNESGESEYGVITVQLLPLPPVFSIIEDKIGQDWFSFRWTPVENAVSYSILINDGFVANIPSSLTEYQVVNLTPGDIVSIKMVAENNSGLSEQSESLIVQLKPATPILALSEVASWSCNLEWSASNGAMRYKVYKNGEFAILNVPSTIQKVTIKDDVVAGMTASYTVRAENDSGESPDSNMVVVTYTKDRTIIRNQGKVAIVNADSYQFSDIISSTMQGTPTIWVYFPPELLVPMLELEVRYLEDLISHPDLENIIFIGVFTQDTVKISKKRASNLIWKKAKKSSQIRMTGVLPMVRFYSSGGKFQSAIRISMPTMTPDDIYKVLPEVFEKSSGMILYKEEKDKFNALHDER